MKNKKKWRINKDKVFRNIIVIITIIMTVILIHKIATNGIGWMSTIGYFK